MSLFSKFILIPCFVVLVMLMLFGCASKPVEQPKPKRIDYKQPTMIASEL